MYKRAGFEPVWCKGCGNYAVLTALIKVFEELELNPADIVITSGIGCSGRFSHYLNVYSLHGTHGRAIPAAIGVKAARPKLTVLSVSGDGDATGIGGGHLPHAARRNPDLTSLILDNNTYALTKGQVSPMTPEGTRTKTTPYGSGDDPLDILPMLLVYNTSFVANTSSSNMKELILLLKEAILHRGFSIVRIFSPCVTYPVLSWQTLKEQLSPLPEHYSPTDKMAALQMAYCREPVYTGVLFKQRKPTMEEKIQQEIQMACTLEHADGRKYTPLEIMQSYL